MGNKSIIYQKKKANKSSVKHQPAKPTKNQKSKTSELTSAKAVFRVDEGRAMKAKKNKAVVKFQKAREKNRTAETIKMLNNNMDDFRRTAKSFTKKANPFSNPVARANQERERTTHDLDAAIDKLGSL